MPNSLFCPLRKIWVSALPEEIVRHKLVLKMIQHLGYPIGNLALEKSLHQLPHLQMKPSLPQRRADLIVFAKNLHPQHSLYPLLLVECKATPLSNKVLQQMVGYNHFVGAYFIAAVNQTEAYFGYYHAEYKDYMFTKGFPSYQDLLKTSFVK